MRHSLTFFCLCVDDLKEKVAGLAQLLLSADRLAEVSQSDVEAVERDGIVVQTVLVLVVNTGHDGYT